MVSSDVLRDVESILLVDFPSREVPETLARAGYSVVAHGGPGPEEYYSYEVEDGEVRERFTGRRPERADVVYQYRPVDELPEIVEVARQVGASIVWCESGSEEARRIVEGADLMYVDEPIVDAASG